MSDTSVTCGRCGRPASRLFPRDPEGHVCATCYELLARRNPEWSRVEVLGVVAVVLGVALLLVALAALAVRG